MSEHKVVSNKRNSACGVFKFCRKSPCCTLAAGESGREGVEAAEGGAETVVRSQNTTNAKVAGTGGSGRE